MLQEDEKLKGNFSVMSCSSWLAYIRLLICVGLKHLHLHLLDAALFFYPSFLFCLVEILQKDKTIKHFF